MSKADEMFEELGYKKSEKENAEWLGLSNIKAINNVVKENIRLKYQDIPYLEGTIKGYKARNEELEAILEANTTEHIGVVNQLEQLEKENEELRATLKCTQDSWFEDTKKIEELKDYIPKSVIRDKIEELSYKRDKTEIAYYLDAKIDILKELLGDE